MEELSTNRENSNKKFEECRARLSREAYELAMSCSMMGYDPFKDGYDNMLLRRQYKKFRHMFKRNRGRQLHIQKFLEWVGPRINIKGHKFDFYKKPGGMWEGVKPSTPFTSHLAKCQEKYEKRSRIKKLLNSSDKPYKKYPHSYMPYSTAKAKYMLHKRNNPWICSNNITPAHSVIGIIKADLSQVLKVSISKRGSFYPEVYLTEDGIIEYALLDPLDGLWLAWVKGKWFSNSFGKGMTKAEAINECRVRMTQVTIRMLKDEWKMFPDDALNYLIRYGDRDNLYFLFPYGKSWYQVEKFLGKHMDTVIPIKIPIEIIQPTLWKN